MAERLGRELVPAGLWQIVEPLLSPQRERRQGGGTRYVDDRAVFTAIVYVLITGCAWRHLPAELGSSRLPRTVNPPPSAPEASWRGHRQQDPDSPNW